MSAGQKKQSWFEVMIPFVNGGFSGCVATAIIQPVDMIKVQIQIKSELAAKAKAAGQPPVSTSPVDIAKEIYSQGGAKLFYKGLSAGLTRQVFYTTTRFGVYQNLFNKTKKKAGNRPLTFFEKSYCAISAGFIGAFVGNPPDLALIRMQNDSALPPAERRNYNGVFDAFRKIVAQEGITGLWKGAVPTIVRACALNFAMLGVYDELKERINLMVNGAANKDTQTTKLLASALTGVTSSLAALPFDNSKTKIQKQKPGPDGKLPYKNIFDALVKTAKNEGVLGLWVGYPTFYFRIAPHVMITLILNDYLKEVTDAWKKKQH